MKIVHLISRFLVGIVFMFSGIVKGIDPLGTAYRLEDYFIAFGTDFMMPAALFLSILLSTMEFTLGFVVLLNLKPRVNAWLLMGVMVFFTVLTLNDAISNPVPDCGCFGDAIKLTNWETFYKNIILMVPTIILFVWRKKTIDRLNNVAAYGIAAFVALVFAAFSHYNYKHLPMVDFMDWKIGNKMYTESTLPVKYYVTYKNKETGEQKEYLLPDYPYNDSIWMSQWEFVDQRVEDPNRHLGSDLMIVDLEGNDLTDVIIRNPDTSFIFISWDVEKADEEGLVRMNDFYEESEVAGYTFSAVTSSLEETIGKVSKKLNLEYTFYQADDIVLKTMVRSNPGLIMMKDGVVLDKWSYHDLPEYNEIRKSRSEK